MFGIVDEREIEPTGRKWIIPDYNQVQEGNFSSLLILFPLADITWDIAVAPWDIAVTLLTRSYTDVTSADHFNAISRYFANALSF